MALFQVLTAELIEFIKNRKKSPEDIYMEETTLDYNDKKDFLFRIDYFLKNEDKRPVQFYIEEYIKHHTKDKDITIRIDKLKKL